MTSMTFGKFLSDARKNENLSQKELAARIKKEDGLTISPQYLNDIERDRRNPPSEYILKQFAKVLNLKLDVVYYWADRMPADVKSSNDVGDDRVVAAYKAFRKALEGK